MRSDKDWKTTGREGGTEKSDIQRKIVEKGDKQRERDMEGERLSSVVGVVPCRGV